MTTISSSSPRLVSHKTSQSSTFPGLDSDSYTKSYCRGRKNSFVPSPSTTRSVYSSSYDSQASSRSSFITGLDDASDIAPELASKTSDSKSKARSGSPEQQGFIEESSFLAGKVVDEAIAAIEISNRELRLRVQKAEESTRVLQEQNLDLYRKISQVTKHSCPESCQSYRADQISGCTCSSLTDELPDISHELSARWLRASMSSNVRRTRNNSHDVRSGARHRRYGSQPSIPGTMSTPFRDTVSEPLVYNSSATYRHQDSQPSSEIPATSISQKNLSEPFRKNHDSLDRRYERKLSHASIKESSPRGSSTKNLGPSYQFQFNRVAEANAPAVKRPTLPDFGSTKTTRAKTTINVVPPSNSKHLRTVFPNPPTSISSPLHGTIEHHAVLFDGKSLSPCSRPNMISLEEARRRAKSLPLIHDPQGEYLVETGHIIEGESKPLWNEPNLSAPNKGDAVRMGKKKSFSSSPGTRQYFIVGVMRAHQRSKS